ncbi:MAG: N-acetylmuramoyl-L-alanine amidase, partial [Emcibacter sp.]|nr:N-acetylmuramoyl-L-alanine amidase [Emcibacter sp.]
MLAGGVTGFSFAPFYLFPLLAISFPLLLLALPRAGRLWTAYAYGWYFGFGQFFTGLIWIATAFEVDDRYPAVAGYLAVGALAIALAGGAPAQQAGAGQKLQGLARLDAAASLVRDTGSGGVEITLALSQAVPYRGFTLANPARLVIDFREVRFPALTLRDLVSSRQVSFLRTGLFRPGWSRMVLGLKHPVRVASAAMRTDPDKGTAVIRIRLEQETPEAFLREVGPGKNDFWALPRPAVPVPGGKVGRKDRHKLLVALDPGRGGMDLGAQYQGHTEAGLMLTLARELKERLVRTGRYDVFLTRNEDVFLSLQGRVSLARAAGADVFISLHADALAQGTASGTTVYTLSAEASDKASAWLAAS